MEQTSRRYDPPESVVGPAFAELLNRLRRARLSNTPDPQLPKEERVLFDYGVAQRRRVLEHTIFLVFGQWIIYRQVISQSASRALRLTYALGSLTTSAAFLRHRARNVSLDLFAHIVTADSSSALGNEARIVLAELEGPEGPYLRSVIRERGFETAFADTLAAVQASATDSEQVDVHPQLCLKPRLLTENVLSSSHPHILPHIGTENSSRSVQNIAGVKQRIKENIDQPSHESSLRQRSTIRMRSRPTVDTESYHDSQLEKGQFQAPFTVDEALNTDDIPTLHKGRTSTNDTLRTASENDRATSNWGDPFDFSKAVNTHSQGNDTDTDLNPFNDADAFHGDDNNNSSALTPSQRRAAERRKKRLMAKTQSGSDHQLVDDDTVEQRHH